MNESDTRPTWVRFHRPSPKMRSKTVDGAFHAVEADSVKILMSSPCGDSVAESTKKRLGEIVRNVSPSGPKGSWRQRSSQVVNASRPDDPQKEECNQNSSRKVPKQQPLLQEVNQIEVNNIQFPSESKIEKLKDSERGVAHIKLGFSFAEGTTPFFQHALHDTGASHNLIAVSVLHNINDFDQHKVNPVQRSTVRAATGDESHEVYGKIYLNTTFTGDTGETRVINMPFYVVNGLSYDIFLGNSFLQGDLLSHDTPKAMYLKPYPEYEAKLIHDTKLLKVPKVFAKTVSAKLRRDVQIPPKSKMYVSLAYATLYPSDDVMISFSPCEHELPDVHFVPEVLRGGTHAKVMVVNQSDMTALMPKDTRVGTIYHDFTDNILTLNLSEMIQESILVNTDKPVNLNKALHDFQEKDFGRIELNHAMIQTHTMTQEEKNERNKMFKKEGWHQKTVSEVIENINDKPHLEPHSDEDLRPKTDEELVNSCDLSHLSPEQREMAREMLFRNVGAFQRHKLDIGKCKDIVASAPLKGTGTPHLVCKYQAVPRGLRDEAQKMIDKYVAAGVIAQTFDSCPITSNMQLVPKGGGRGHRMVYDGRPLSSVVEQLPTPLPSMEEMFADWATSKYLTIMDVVDAYHSIPVDEKTSRMMSFFAPNGLRYVYLRLAQGLKFSSHFLQNAMDKVLKPVRSHTKNYADDCVCSSSGTFEDHLKKVEETLQRFTEYNIKVNVAKLKLASEEVDILGMTWNRGRLSIPKAKVMGYMNMKNPKSLREAQLLINSLAYYRRFIPNFSEKAYPLQNLITECRANVRKFIWLDIHQKSVDALLDSLKESTSLMLPRTDRKFIIHSDSSYEAVGGTISQYDDDGTPQLVAAISRSFTKSERRHSAVIKEIIGLTYILNSSAYILRGMELEIFADARSICLVKSCSINSPYLARLSMELNQYDFSIHHIDGRINLVADALSRLHKDKETILSSDKTNNEAMSVEESVKMVEALTLPLGYPLTKEQVKTLINSEPLKSSIDKTVKRKITGLQRNPLPKPKAVRDRKPKMPRLVRRHPLDVNHLILNLNKSKSKRSLSLPRNWKQSLSVNRNCDKELAINLIWHADFLLGNSNTSKESNTTDSISSAAPDVELSPELQVNQAEIGANSFGRYRPSRRTEFIQYAQNIYNKSSDQILDPRHIILPPRSLPFKVNEECMGQFGSPEQLEHTLVLNNVVGIDNSDLKKPKIFCNHLEIDPNLKTFDIKANIIKNGTISVKDFKDAQELDPEIAKSKDEFKRHPRRKYLIKQDILHRLVDDVPKPILPSSLEKLYFNSIHFHAFSAHRSADAMIKLARDQYYIPEAEEKIKKFTANCFVCKTHKSQRMRKDVQGITVKPTRPRQICSFDIAGGLESTRGGDRYLYLFVDNFSLFCSGIAAKTKSEEELRRGFLTTFAQWSQIPEVVVSDQEPGLLTEGMREFFDSLNIKHHVGGGYSPHRNLCETAAIRKVKEFVRGCMAQTNEPWFNVVPMALMCANQTPTYLGYAPEQIHYGDVKKPHALIESVTPVKNLDEYIRECTKKNKALWKHIKEKRQGFADKRQETANLHRDSKDFKVNDLVWVKSLKITPYRATKVFNKGPYIILKKQGTHNYHLAKPEEPDKSVSISHASNMSKFRESVDLTPITFPDLEI